MTQTTTKEIFYKLLFGEKRDIISSSLHTEGTFYPLTSEFKYRHSSQLFGKCITLGYINGIYTQNFFLNK